MKFPPMIGVLLCCGCLGSLGWSQSPGDTPERMEGAIVDDNYLVLAAENTPLQKFLLGTYGEVDYAVHLLVDGQVFFREDTIDIDALDWEKLKRDLNRVFQTHLLKHLKDPPKKALMIRVYFTSGTPQQREYATWLLSGFAKQAARFTIVNLSMTVSQGGQSFREKCESCIHEGASLVNYDADESPKENEFVSVYPVRTVLSRLMTSDADCMAVIKPKFSNEFNEQLPRSVRTSMSVFMTQLELERRLKVAFSMRYDETSGKEAREWFLESGGREFSQFLGFERSSITIGLQR